MHERIISARKKIKYKKHRNKNTKMNRRKLHCPTIIKKSKKYARIKKHPLKNLKKYKKPFSQALLILYGKKKY